MGEPLALPDLVVRGALRLTSLLFATMGRAMMMEERWSRLFGNRYAARVPLVLIVAFTAVGGRGNAQTLQEQILEARDKVTPALVNVQPITDVYSSGERRSATGVGSGFIFEDEGHVITNYHVAGRAKRLIITLSNKQRVPGVVVGEDPLTDIAVLKLELGEAHALPRPVALGDSDTLAVGEYVMALGSPLALQRSLSFGVVSSKDRYLSDSFKLPTGEKTGSFNTWKVEAV